MAEAKFTNFKRFIEPYVPGLMTYAVMAMSLEDFLGLLREMAYMSTAEMITTVTNIAGLNIDELKSQDVEKFARYIEYFQKVAARH